MTTDRRIAVLAALVVGLVIAIVAVVSLTRDDGGPPADSSVATQAASTTAASSTTSSAPAAATTAPAAAAARFEVGVPSILPPLPIGEHLASGSGCMGDDGPLPDGVWYGTLLEKPRSDSLVFDVACLFFGDASYEAAEQDGLDSFDVNNDLYIRDESVATRTVLVDDRAAVYFIPGGDPGAGFRTVPWPSWLGDEVFCPGPSCGVWLYVNGGLVTEVAVQWFP